MVIFLNTKRVAALSLILLGSVSCSPNAFAMEETPEEIVGNVLNLQATLNGTMQDSDNAIKAYKKQIERCAVLISQEGLQSDQKATAEQLQKEYGQSLSQLMAKKAEMCKALEKSEKLLGTTYISYARLGKRAEGVKILEPIAEGGDADAQIRVAFEYKVGTDVETNHPKAVWFYKRAMDQGRIGTKVYLDELLRTKFDQEGGVN